MTAKNQILSLLVSLLCLTAALPAKSGETTPLWLNAGESALNANVSNDTYRIMVLHTWGPTEKALEETCLYSLQKYIKENYGAIEQSISIEKTSGGDQPVFFVNFRTDGSDKTNFIVAKLIDSCSKYEDFDVNVFQYEFYQLFAVSNLNEYPVYDAFNTSYVSKSQIIPMAFVPGMAQIVKGQKTKGMIILGGEIGFVSAALIFENKRAYARRQMDVCNPGFVQSWRSKQISWRNFRYGAWGCAGALYIYNIIDALTSDGGRKLEVKKTWTSNLSLTPWVAPDFTGLQVTLNF